MRIRILTYKCSFGGAVNARSIRSLWFGPMWNCFGALACTRNRWTHFVATMLTFGSACANAQIAARHADLEKTVG